MDIGPVERLSSADCLSNLPPQKRLTEERLLPEFHQSACERHILAFLNALNEKTRNKSLLSIQDNQQLSTVPVNGILDLLNELYAWIENFPPVTDVKQRFGNTAFRDWHGMLTAQVLELIQRHLIDKMKPIELWWWPTAQTELCAYLLNGFGNQIRYERFVNAVI